MILFINHEGIIELIELIDLNHDNSVALEIIVK